MKLILSLTAALTLIANVALAAPPSIHARNPHCPNDSSNAAHFLRADKYKADHFYSTDPREILQSVNNFGYIANGTVGGIFHTLEVGTIALYRLYNKVLKDHTYTSDTQEARELFGQGYSSEGIAGYVLQGASCPFHGYRVLPLLRYYSDQETAHFLTTGVVEGPPAGYKVDTKHSPSVGYVLV